MYSTYMRTELQPYSCLYSRLPIFNFASKHLKRFMAWSMTAKKKVEKRRVFGSIQFSLKKHELESCLTKLERVKNLVALASMYVACSCLSIFLFKARPSLTCSPVSLNRKKSSLWRLDSINSKTSFNHRHRRHASRLLCVRRRKIHLAIPRRWAWSMALEKSKLAKFDLSCPLSWAGKCGKYTATGCWLNGHFDWEVTMSSPNSP